MQEEIKEFMKFRLAQLLSGQDMQYSGVGTGVFRMLSHTFMPYILSNTSGWGHVAPEMPISMWGSHRRSDGREKQTTRTKIALAFVQISDSVILIMLGAS
jgi:hypothetical protein